MFDFFRQSHLIERNVFVEYLADSFVELTVHFQDVCLAHATLLAGLYHVEHAVELNPVHEILVRNWLGLRVRVFRVLLLLFGKLVFLDD